MQHEQFALHADIEERHWWFVARRRIMRALIHTVLPPTKEKLIIDVGCGTGANIASLAADYSCMGIDPHTDAIAYANKRFPGIRFVCGMAPADLGEAVKTADVYLLMDVLEHIEDDYGFLRSLVEAMKPGARLFLTVPAKMSLWSQHDVSFGHFRRYEEDTLCAVWKTLPVEVELLSFYNSRLYPLVRAFRWISRLRKKPMGREGTDLSMPMAPLNHLLTEIFTGETKRLDRLLQKKSMRRYESGTSLIVILQRREMHL